jgi:hypothetical protein
MGWSQTEPTRKTHFTEYMHFEAGDEAAKRIDRFNKLSQQAKAMKANIPAHLSDAYFQLIEYPAVCAGLMNKKFLHMEKAYYYARQERASANDFAQMSKAAFDSIKLYTDYFNTTLANGKWGNMMYMRPRSLPVFDMPLVPQWEIPETNNWAIATEGDEEIRRASEVKGPLNLPTFNNLTRRSYFVDLFLFGNGTVDWVAEPTHDWIKVSSSSGTLSGGFGQKQSRVWISIDWDKTPESTRFNGLVRFKGADRTRTVQIYASRQNFDTSNGHLFVDDNGYISIFAENFNNVNNTESFGWSIIDGLGYTGKSVWVNPLEDKAYDPELKNPSALEYQFVARRRGKIAVTVHCIPVHPINEHYGLKFGIATNNEKPQILDHQTFGRSEEWKVNVLRNSAIVQSEHQIESDGKQTLKLFALDPGVIIDRITINSGGLVKSYSTLDETRVE